MDNCKWYLFCDIKSEVVGAYASVGKKTFKASMPLVTFLYYSGVAHQIIADSIYLWKK